MVRKEVGFYQGYTVEEGDRHKKCEANEGSVEYNLLDHDVDATAHVVWRHMSDTTRSIDGEYVNEQSDKAAATPP